jgi:hypothetical protein
MKSLFRIETKSSAPISANGTQISFQSRAISLTLPGFGFVWNRPTTVLTRSSDGREQTLAVRDVTRLVQVLVLTLGLAGAILIRLKR